MFVLVDGDSKQRGSTVLNQRILYSMAPKQTYFSHGEAFAPKFSACIMVAACWENRSVIWLIDNMGVLAYYTKGSSVVADI